MANIYSNTLDIEYGFYKLYFNTFTEVSTKSSTINSNSKIKKTVQKTLNSNSKVIDQSVATINSNTKVQGINTKTLISDAKVKQVGVQKTIDLDGRIINARTQEIINSNSFILYRIEKAINSNARIKGQSIETINSNSKLINKIQETIDLNARVKQANILEVINSDGKILHRTQETINSNTYIRYKKDFYTRLETQNVGQVDFYNQLKVNQSTPINPTNLVATDPQTGDSIILNWTDSGNYGYNIYKDDGGWVKQNGSVIKIDNCTIGNLTSGVTYTFQIRGVNGIGVESSGLSITGITYPNDTTPTFNMQHYTDTSFKIEIGGVEQTNAILNSVELVYGTAMSTADFYIVEDPRTVGLPEAIRQEVKVYINNRKVFTGILLSREDVYNSNSLRVNYIAVDTRYNEKLNTVGENAPKPPEIPDDIWNPMYVADLNYLEYREFSLKYKGNYRIYCDEDGVIGEYQIGQPITQRTFEVGKHILEHNIKQDWSTPTAKVIIYSAETQYTRCEPWIISGQTKRLNAKGISNIQVFAKINHKPQVISYLDSIEVLPEHVENVFGNYKFTTPSITWRESGETQTAYEGRVQNADSNKSKVRWGDGGSEGRHPVIDFKHYFSTWQAVSSEVEYDEDGNGCCIKVSPTPKKWHSNIQSGNVKFIASDGTNPSETSLYVSIWNEPYWATAAKKVVYTYLGERRSKKSGTGISTKTIHDNINPVDISIPSNVPYQYESGNNFNTVDEYLQNRADIEATKLSSGINKGTMTVLGDATLNLRMHVNGLEVIKVTHDFSSGAYVCHLDLTDEAFYPGLIMHISDELKQREEDNTFNTEFIVSKYYDIKKVKAIVGDQGHDQGVDPKAGIAHYSD